MAFQGGIEDPDLVRRSFREIIRIARPNARVIVHPIVANNHSSYDLDAERVLFAQYDFHSGKTLTLEEFLEVIGYGKTVEFADKVYLVQIDYEYDRENIFGVCFKVIKIDAIVSDGSVALAA